MVLVGRTIRTSCRDKLEEGACRTNRGRVTRRPGSARTRRHPSSKSCKPHGREHPINTCPKIRKFRHGNQNSTVVRNSTAPRHSGAPEKLRGVSFATDRIQEEKHASCGKPVRGTSRRPMSALRGRYFAHAGLLQRVLKPSEIHGSNEERLPAVYPLHPKARRCVDISLSEESRSASRMA